MSQQSSIYIRLVQTGSEIHFSGVTQVRHSLSLKVATDTDDIDTSDYVNGARKQPAKVTLSLVETDIGHSKGYAARIAQNLEAARASRTVIQVITPVKIYNNMILSDLVILEEEGKPDAWSGTATFTEVDLNNSSTKTQNNSSTVTDTGTAETVLITNYKKLDVESSKGSGGSEESSGGSVSYGATTKGGSGSGSGSGAAALSLRQVLTKANIELT